MLSVMHPVPIALIGLFAATSAASQQVSRPQCQVNSDAGDVRDFTCTLHEPEVGRRYRFEAGFTGSHDDTVLDMTATLDDHPVACAGGSTTHSQYEDGDITLVCRFELKARSAAPVLRVRLRWRHAEPTTFDLQSE